MSGERKGKIRWWLETFFVFSFSDHLACFLCLNLNTEFLGSFGFEVSPSAPLVNCQGFSFTCIGDR